MTPDLKQTVMLNPPADLPVDATPMFDGEECIIDAPPCVDEGNICGNLCEIPAALTCQEIADLFQISLTRFRELNPSMTCTGIYPDGTSGELFPGWPCCFFEKRLPSPLTNDAFVTCRCSV